MTQEASRKICDWASASDWERAKPGRTWGLELDTQGAGCSRMSMQIPSTFIRLETQRHGSGNNNKPQAHILHNSLDQDTSQWPK